MKKFLILNLILAGCATQQNGLRFLTGEEVLVRRGPFRGCMGSVTQAFSAEVMSVHLEKCPIAMDPPSFQTFTAAQLDFGVSE